MGRVDFICMLDTAKLKAERERRGLSMSAAAKQCEMGTAQAWNKIENGDGLSLNLRTLNKIAKGLGVSAKSLLK